MDTGIWLKYKSLLVNTKVAFKSREWYLRWARAFEKSLKNKPLSECTKEDVQAYVEQLVKRNKYQDWQLQQANNALRLLFEKCFRGMPLSPVDTICSGFLFNSFNVGFYKVFVKFACFQ